jgi:hypothetical protein
MSLSGKLETMTSCKQKLENRPRATLKNYDIENITICEL